MPMFINNLQKSELLDFQEWTKTHFGISFEVTSKEGHVSLMIKDDSNHMYNLADEGVGYSRFCLLLQICGLLQEIKTSAEQGIHGMQIIMIN